MTTTNFRRPIVLALAAVAGVVAWRPAMAIEEPRYTVLQSSDQFEIRRYSPYVVAEVEVQGDFEEAGSRGFGPLADYIFGNNVANQDTEVPGSGRAEGPGERLAMTSPVLQQERDGEKIEMTAPVMQQDVPGRRLVRFVMPGSRSLATLPTPRNPRVQLLQVPGDTYAVIRYSGRWTADNYNKHLDELRREIRARGFEETGTAQWARYNAPYTPWFLRRNEILVPVRSPASGKATLSRPAPQALDAISAERSDG
ncbi:MAG: heme-binding protein [Pseudomonadota bacterium]